MKHEDNISLAPFTSLGVGGAAEKLITVNDSSELEQCLLEQPVSWMIGYGTNVLISDKGLGGLTVRTISGKINRDDDLLIADAGVKWDHLVLHAIENKLWGIELLSGVPGCVGGAAFINITAYGQSQADSLVWVEVFSKKTNTVKRMSKSELALDYKQSLFQNDSDLLILRAAYQLSNEVTHELTYQSALDAAAEIGADITSLEGRRQTILEARKQADSLFEYDGNYAKTAGSFFKNPMVSPEQAEMLMKMDETQKTAEQIRNMNKVHGGDQLRVSAAHALLAGGFKRGQSWGQVRLNPNHVLKLENAGGASAQEIYDVAMEIISTCQTKLGITLEPEVRFLGDFS